MRASISSSFSVSMGMEMRWIMERAAWRALLYAEMITTGWMSRSSWERDWARISPAGDDWLDAPFHV